MHCQEFVYVAVVLALYPLVALGRATQQQVLQVKNDGPRTQNSKSIAIVGAGSAGLAVLKALLDLPQHVRQGWEIELFEERRSVGGIWLPDPSDPHPPELPETPLYPSLKTNTPHPTMTYPHFPFRPLTPLFPSHEHVEQYHVDFAIHFGLFPYINLNTSVVRAAWVGDTSLGIWNVTVLDKRSEVHNHRLFDHLIVANGHNRYPHIPTWPGQDDWLGAKEGREILHTVFWRNGTKYAGKSVLVVGNGASARDAVLHTAPAAERVYLSLRSGSPPGRVDVPYILKPAISHFTADNIIFADGTHISDIDAIILGTGYDLRIPFLSDGGALAVSPNASGSGPAPGHLTTNLRYIYPLHAHIFSLCSAHPPTALAFVGLPVLVANCPSDFAQALLVAHALADAALLPARRAMRAQLRAREAHFRARGFDPYRVGHRLIDVDAGGEGADGRAPDASHVYQDELVRFLKERGAIPDDGLPYVEDWRRRSRNESEALWLAWQRVEKLGEREVRRWLKGVRTEEDWADVMQRLTEWEKQKR